MSKSQTPSPDTHIVPGTGSDAARKAANTDNMQTAVHRSIVGKLTIIDGPGKGATFDLFDGTHAVGRDARNHIALDFGDATVHRNDHAFLNYVKGAFELHDNGKPNPVEVNGKILVGSQIVTPADRLMIGKTTLQITLK